MLKISPSLLFSVLLILFFSLLGNVYFIQRADEQNRVIRVVDGDSFDLKDGRRIRLLGIDAPEKNRCMFEVGREKLEEMILDKRVRLENTVVDDYGRILANVFAGNMFVNKVMLEEGLVRFLYVKSPYYDELKASFTKAKAEKIGVFSLACTSQTNPNCMIKGNIREGEKIYHLPNCKNYHQVEVQQAFGDEWFCNQQEALEAGFRKVEGCR